MTATVPEFAVGTTAQSSPPKKPARNRGPREHRGAGWRVNLARIGVVVVILLVWHIAATLGVVNPILLPSPLAVFQDFVERMIDGTLPASVGFTLRSAAIGFVIGMVVGVALGFLIGLSQTATKIASPFITIFNAMPRIALAPMFVLWFGIGLGSGVALVVSLVVFIALTNTLAGAQSVERNQLTLARLYGASRAQMILKVILPATVPWILAAGHLALANALSGAIVSEMFLGQNGLGFLIVTSSGLFNMAGVFAAIFMAMIVAAILDWLGSMLETYLLRWRPPQL